MNLLRRETRMYGYEITRILDEQSGGRIRKYHSLTEKGRKKAESLLTEFNEYLDLMQRLIKK